METIVKRSAGRLRLWPASKYLYEHTFPACKGAGLCFVFKMRVETLENRLKRLKCVCGQSLRYSSQFHFFGVFDDRDSSPARRSSPRYKVWHDI